MLHLLQNNVQCSQLMFKYLLLLLLCTSVQSAEPVKAVITVDHDVYNDVQRFLNGRDPLQIQHFDSADARRDVVDFILIQQAIALGGVALDIRFVTGNYDSRNVRSIASGMLLISLDSFWLSELQKVAADIYISDPLIRRGEYFAGLYTAATNKAALATQTVEQLRQLSVVSYSGWSADWRTLTQLQLPKLLEEKSWSSQAKLVSRGWVDVMLAPFLPGTQFTFKGDGYEVIAIPGIKLMLDDSRHVAVSKHHPAGEQVFAALQRGLKQLRAEGRIKRAYTEAGFFNTHVVDWRLLNPLPTPIVETSTQTDAPIR